MSNQDQPMKPTSQTTGIGARLKATRETMGLSEKEAAHRLHLSAKFISIIENEDFENGPPPTFIRGYIRSYARLLNFSENDITNILEQLGMNTSPTVVVPPRLHSQPINDNSDRYLRWVSYLVIAFLIASVGIWWATHSSNDTDTETKATATPTQNTNTALSPAANTASAPETAAPATPVPAANNVVTPTLPENTASPSQAPAETTAPQPVPPASTTAPETEALPIQQAAPDAQQTDPVPQPSLVPPMPNLSTTLTETPSEETTAPPPSKKRRHRSPTMRMVSPEPGLGF